MILLPQPSLVVSLQFNELNHVGALDLSSFVFDFNRLYVSVFRLSNGISSPARSAFLGRQNFRLPEQFELGISRIIYNSPLSLDFLAPMNSAADALLKVVQVYKEIKSLPIERKILETELRKKEIELENAQIVNKELKLNQMLRDENVSRAMQSLNASRMKPKTIGVRIDVRF